MEFGLITLFDFYSGPQHEARHYHETLDLVAGAEPLGYRSVWVGEEHFYAFGICPNPQMFLSSVAQRTRTMRLGTSISVLPIDHPIRKAEDFAILDIVSNGRVNFGAGRGGVPRHFQGFGIKPEESRPRYEEALEIIQKLWTLDSVTHEGQFWQLRDVKLSPKPVQKPHPPIYRGTVSEESFVAAGKVGQNAFIVPWTTGVPHHEIRERVDGYRKALAENNHPMGRTAAIFFMLCHRDRQTAFDIARRATRAYAEKITSYLRESSLQHAAGAANTKHNEFLLAIADNLEHRAIVGDPRDCKRRIEELDEELGGLDQVCFYVNSGGLEASEASASLELFSREVMPYFDAQAAVASGAAQLEEVK